MKLFLLLKLLILSTLISITCNRKHPDCTYFKTGKFLLYSRATNKKYFIERNDSFQIEIDSLSKRISRSKITWINDCEYYLVNIPDSSSERDKLDAFFESAPIKTTILKTTPFYYIFSSKVDSMGKELIIIDTMRSIK
jgi:hypothetical protein